jgi:hypothetical protein
MTIYRIACAAILCVFLHQRLVAAATFTGQTTATFRMVEYLDGSTTTVQQATPIFVTLTTDYSNISWTMEFDVDLLMAGGPTQAFETRLKAQGSFGTEASSPLTFPDSSGSASAGTYGLVGNATWIRSKRIVTATDTMTVGPNSWTTPAYTFNVHRFNVLSYPTSVRLLTSLSQLGVYSIGKTGNTTNGTDVTVDFSSQMQNMNLFEQLPGDFNSSSTVDRC